MEIINKVLLERFARRHANVRPSISYFILTLEACKAANPAELRQTFGSVDFVRGYTVFDLGGNKGRVIAVTLYVAGKVYIKEVFASHREYERWRPQ